MHDVVRSPGRPLDPATRAFFEPRLGADLGRVRIHTDARAAESARAVRALAYTVGPDVVMGEGRFSPHTAAGQRLLAHELAHTVQQGAAPALPAASAVIGGPGGVHERQGARGAADVRRGAPLPRVSRSAAPVVARTPEVRPPTDEDRRTMVDIAARWLASLADHVETMRTTAAAVRATTTAGDADARRAFHQRLNQEVLGRLLANAVSVFQAQRSDLPGVNFPAESPEQTRMGEAYARAMEQIGLAMSEARANAAGMAPAIRDSEEAAYLRNHVRWLDANPAMPLNAGIRTTFTQAEVDISARRHQSVSAELNTLVADVHRYDLAGNGADRLRLALQNAVYRLERDPATGGVHARPDAALQATIQPVLDNLAGIQWAIDQAVDRLRRAESRTRAFAADPAGNQAAGDTLQTHFHTRDPGYATLLADRLARLGRELRGEGRLTVHARNPGDPSCRLRSVGITAAHADANRFYFCSTVAPGNDGTVSTVIHETVHAVIPGLGATGAVSSSADTPDDRAYEFERIYAHLSTEEALQNAESYSWYVDALLGVAVTRTSAPQDTVTGCADPAPVHSAIARAIYRIRLGAMWAGQYPGRPAPQFLTDIVREGFPGADTARTGEVLNHMSALGARLHYALQVRCRPASDPEGAGGALAYGRSARATADGVAATSHTYPYGTLRILPTWFNAGTAAQEDSLAALVVMHHGDTVPAADVRGLVVLARHIQEQAHPSVATRTLAQHQAADAPPAPAPAPSVPAPAPSAPTP
ncbi:MAG TPA: DUF4157 domain-containing protein [Longimicrobium sp.]